ncbi:LytTR family transcriptional regulator [Algoriphagus sp. AGSA1]|uniref:LytR/AlgR family response regulator transcription factor n=1 Tax=Algoriphagus sp. AGSA1 TaxID=2907213 RepID=UPI001F47F446|nr:LytTR family DNA-binding domain-containing protein [Algoriphagus sp. AGSA1]MCE7055379.1 LytTR family transcriptional regulator [Algoriphagus sp. AGSA1]
MSPIFQEKKLRIKATLKYLVVLLLVLLVTIFQDYLHSRYNAYSFYASESFLFNMFWILILPVSLIFNRAFTKNATLARIHVLWVKRIAFILLASFLHILLFAGMVHVVSALFYDHTFSFFANLNYTIAQDLYKYLLIYSVLALVLFRKESLKAEETPKINHLNQIIVDSGRSKSVVKTADIYYIRAEVPYVAIHTSEKKYLHTATLKSILELLPPEKFVRVHKSTIINLSKVVSYKSRLNGDYDIRLSNEQELRLSRNYADIFRQRFTSHQSS